MKKAKMNRCWCRSAWSPLAFWILHAVLLLTVVLWAAIDPRFESSVGQIVDSAAAQPTWGGTVRSVAAATESWSRGAALVGIASIAVVSWCFLLIGLVVGTRRFRGLRSLLVVITLSGFWLAVAMGYPEIAWQGQRAKLSWRVQRLDSIARTLRERWPQADGEHQQLGQFMAYPFGQPRTLVLLTPPQFDRFGTKLSVVERSASGSLMFQLSSLSRDDWVEWHPEVSSPRSFTGGLSDSHQIDRSVALGGGWHLVRYERS